MLGSNIDRMLKKVKLHAAQEGREEGREEGRQEGLEQGKRSTLLKLLQLKFGGTSMDREQRVSEMEGERLDRAMERILGAQSEEEVFEGSL